VKTFRIVLGILAIIPVALVVDHIFITSDYYGEESLKEMIYMVIGIPILVLNLWAWGYLPIIQYYFRGKEIEDT